MSRTEVMRGYVPRYLLTAPEYAAIIDSQGSEFDSLRDNIVSILEQFFIHTATWGLARWEEFLGLDSYAGKPDDQRRSRIISKLRGVGTVTVEMIKNVAESYANGTVEVEELPTEYSMVITFVDQHGIPPNYTDLQAAIAEIIPAHLAVSYLLRYLLWSELDAKNLTWDELDVKSLAWNEFELGGWIDA